MRRSRLLILLLCLATGCTPVEVSGGLGPTATMRVGDGPTKGLGAALLGGSSSTPGDAAVFYLPEGYSGTATIYRESGPSPSYQASFGEK